jgi:nitroimidazol reductase NimA-like FMN-containing flavoprotein (pyridoxamine 5'-phosphate oxidase superfamily)
MTDAEVATFLDEPGHLVRIGTVDSDGLPRVVPTWFILHDGAIVFTPRGPAAFLANIRRDPRIGLSIDEDPIPYRKVTVQGRAVILHEPGEDDVWRDLYRTIAKRYVPAEAADAYVDDTVDQPRALIAVPMAGEGVRVSSWRMPGEGEDGTGIWARRYYLDGTHMADLADSGKGRPNYTP